MVTVVCGFATLPRPKGSNGTLLCYMLQLAGPELLCPTRLHDMLLCYPTGSDGTLLEAAVGWLCAAVLGL